MSTNDMVNKNSSFCHLIPSYYRKHHLFCTISYYFNQLTTQYNNFILINLPVDLTIISSDLLPSWMVFYCYIVNNSPFHFHLHIVYILCLCHYLICKFSLSYNDLLSGGPLQFKFLNFIEIFTGCHSKWIKHDCSLDISISVFKLW